MLAGRTEDLLVGGLIDRYWPQAGETHSQHGRLSVMCTSERKTLSATVRELQLANDAVSD